LLSVPIVMRTVDAEAPAVPALFGPSTSGCLCVVDVHDSVVAGERHHQQRHHRRAG
jgi:hypothetical protein